MKETDLRTISAFIFFPPDTCKDMWKSPCLFAPVERVILIDPYLMATISKVASGFVIVIYDILFPNGTVLAMTRFATVVLFHIRRRKFSMSPRAFKCQKPFANTSTNHTLGDTNTSTNHTMTWGETIESIFLSLKFRYLFLLSTAEIECLLKRFSIPSKLVC